ncbi:MAG: hypothetical protein GQF41_2712 [Candidatus Rifleibacterium amylolyticum]|nr:MAG: hypothetical protein GQF41_2712 [Candidatus Rifleibacterium amylolyticum]
MEQVFSRLAVPAKIPTLLFFLYLVFIFPFRLPACDNTLLELMTGSSAQAEINEKLLVISSKMQVTATLSQAFNHAAAEKLHHEAMDSWLYVAAQITSNPPGQAAEDAGFSSLLVDISRDLGFVRQQIAARQLEDVHDRLEICVSRMSLLAAMINGNQRMKQFLGFEILLLGLRPLPLFFEQSRNAIANADFITALTGLNLPETVDIKEKAASLADNFKRLKESASADGGAFSRQTLTAYLTLYNEFSAMKKLLLAEKYFVTP